MNKETASPSQNDKIWAAVSYIWILSLVVLVAGKKNEFVHFHARQGVFLFALSLFCWFPVFGWLLGIVVFVCAVVGIIKAVNGEKWNIPVFSSTAQKFGDWVVKIFKI